MYKPDTDQSHAPGSILDYFISATHVLPYDREQVIGCQYYDAIHDEQLNGENVFDFSVPADHSSAQYVAERNLVAFRDLDNYWQFFEIKQIKDVHGDNGLTRTAHCEHILYELLDDIVTDKRPESDARSAMEGMLEGTRWNVGIVDDLGTASTTAYYVSALEAVQSVATAWEGELKWRGNIKNNTIVRYVDLLAMRGSDTGKQFTYAKDISSIEREVDMSSVVTALYGRGKGVETESGEGYGRRLTIAAAVWSLANGDPADKPAGQEWVGDPTALAQWGRPGEKHRFGIYTNEDQTDATTLLQETWDDLQDRKTPSVTYSLDVISLEELSGYEHEAVRLGDLVRVIDREFKPELVVSARVIELKRDLLSPENTEVTLGSFAPTIIDATINTQQRMNDLENKPYNTAWLDGRINVLQNEINNTQSYVFQTATDGILIMDAPTFEQATKAMKMGGGIFAIANQKTGDSWGWRTFGNGDGFTADEINAGKIKAEFIQVGEKTEFEDGYNPVDNHLYFQYSVDNINWHDTFNHTSDLYMRQKVGDNGTWTDGARIAAVDGTDGYTPIKGVDYFDGTDGQNGVDGTSSYLWVRYSQNADGSNMTTIPTNAVYVGIATTTEEIAPTLSASYSWSLIKGTDGIKGEPGTDGRSSYLHIKYSDDGITFTINDGEDVGTYIGTYIDFVQADSTIFSDYTWNKVRGIDGADGVNGTDGTSIEWKGTYASAPASPQNGWAYRNSSNGKSYVYQSGTWYQMTVDGVNGANGADGKDGLSIVWKGELSTPPSSPQENWVYRDTDNGLVYIYNSGAWSLMVADGNDGEQGTNGTDGMSVYITYNDNVTSSQPVTPTGSGTTNGWHTAPTYQTNWMSQKVAADAYSGTWSSPVLISGGRRFTSQPVPPYSVGDLWIGGSSGDLKVCVNARASGSYYYNDWTLASKYTDNTVANQANTNANNAQTAIDNHSTDQSPHNLPSYCKMQSDGFKVYDGSGNLRCHMGQYVSGMYGVKITGGEIIGSSIQTSKPNVGVQGYFVEIKDNNLVTGKIQLPDGSIKTNYQLTTGGNGGALSIFQQDLPIGSIVGWLRNGVPYMTIKADNYTSDFEYNDYCAGVAIGGGSDSAVLKVQKRSRQIISEGNFSVASGYSKNSTEISPTFGTLFLHATEAPDARYYDEGIGQMINGECKIELDLKFLDCIEPNADSTPWLCYATPYNGNLNIYVAELGDSYVLFKDKENNSGAFSWRISAMRKNFSACRFIQPTGE